MRTLPASFRSILLGGLLAGLASACGSSENETPADSSDTACSDEASCATADPITEADKPFALVTPRRAKWPIVLHHGFNASRTNGWSFYGVVDALEADGQRALTTQVEPFHGVPVRAASLATQIDAAIADYCLGQGPAQDLCKQSAKVNLVAHSMGGLDARWLISQLGYAIASPRSPPFPPRTSDRPSPMPASGCSRPTR